jgi:MYXO-CTERM domain-containing protein
LNYYSQVGAFSAVILQAFEAMGATPKTAGGASLGAACTSYAECASGICLGPEGRSYCSEDCPTSACPSGYACTSVSGKQVCEESSSSGGCAVGSEAATSSDLGFLLVALGLGTYRRRWRRIGYPK